MDSETQRLDLENQQLFNRCGELFSVLLRIQRAVIEGRSLETWHDIEIALRTMPEPRLWWPEER